MARKALGGRGVSGKARWVLQGVSRDGIPCHSPTSEWKSLLPSEAQFPLLQNKDTMRSHLAQVPRPSEGSPFLPTPQPPSCRHTLLAQVFTNTSHGSVSDPTFSVRMCSPIPCCARVLESCFLRAGLPFKHFRVVIQRAMLGFSGHCTDNRAEILEPSYRWQY
jgi:hypothetical protein